MKEPNLMYAFLEEQAALQRIRLEDADYKAVDAIMEGINRYGEPDQMEEEEQGLLSITTVRVTAARKRLARFKFPKPAYMASTPAAVAAPIKRNRSQVHRSKSSQPTLTRTNQRKMKEYAEAIGLSVEKSVNEALKEWFGTLRHRGPDL